MVTLWKGISDCKRWPLIKTLKRRYAGNLQCTNHCLSETVTKINELTLFQQVFMGSGFQLLVKIAMGFLSEYPGKKIFQREQFTSRCTKMKCFLTVLFLGCWFTDIITFDSWFSFGCLLFGGCFQRNSMKAKPNSKGQLFKESNLGRGLTQSVGLQIRL